MQGVEVQRPSICLAKRAATQRCVSVTLVVISLEATAACVLSHFTLSLLGS